MKIISPGLVIDDRRLRFLERLGEGGQAEVWKGEECGGLTNRIVAIKVLSIKYEDRNLTENTKKSQKIKDAEASLWPKFQMSPNVVQLFSSFSSIEIIEGEKYLFLGFTMEYSALGDLSQHLGKDLKFADTQEIRRFLLDLAKAVKTGHDVDVIHNDIKPQNVILFEMHGGRIKPKLMDFGTAITASSVEEVGGTPEYMAPERFDGIRNKKSDVYSLGVLFYEILAEKPYFNAGIKNNQERIQVYEQLHKNEQPSLEIIRNRVDEDIERLISSMLDKRPEKRPNMLQVVNGIQNMMTRSLVATAHSLLSSARLQRGLYRWNTTVHEVLGHKLRYHLIRGMSPQADILWFQNNLKEEGVHGYSLYRILGGYDYILRTWVDAARSNKLDEVLERFRNSHGGDFRYFQVSGYDGVPQARTISFQNPAEILEALYESSCAPDGEYNDLKNQKIVRSLLHNNGRNQIRVFVAIKSQNRMGEFHLQACKNHFYEILKQQSEVKHLSVYTGAGDYLMLIKFRLNNFLNYRTVFESMLEASTKMIGHNLTFQSFVEMDAKGYIESDDGPLHEELNEYVRVNHPEAIVAEG